MKIVILQGSPNKKGSTSLLAESFTKGAQEAGHEVERFDIAKMNWCVIVDSKIRE